LESGEERKQRTGRQIELGKLALALPSKARWGPKPRTLQKDNSHIS